MLSYFLSLKDAVLKLKNGLDGEIFCSSGEASITIEGDLSNSFVILAERAIFCSFVKNSPPFFFSEGLIGEAFREVPRP